MNKEYLLQEITEGLEAVNPLSDSLRVETESEILLKVIEEAEMELEHILSSLQTLKSEIE